MTYWLRLFLIAGLLCATSPAHAQGKTKVRLLLSHQTAKPGETVMVGVEFKMQPRWHIYWRNPGESGIPPKIEWALPKGVTVGEIQWPIPEKVLFDTFRTYEYHGAAVLLVPFQIAADAAPGALELSAKISWLECEAEGSCVPGKTELTATLTIGGNSEPSADATLIESAKGKLPMKSEIGFGHAEAKWAGPATGDSRALIIDWHMSGKGGSDLQDFFPYESNTHEIAAATETISHDNDRARLRKLVKKSEGNGWPKEIRGIAVLNKHGSGVLVGAIEFTLPVAPGAADPSTAAPPGRSKPPAPTDASAKVSQPLTVVATEPESLVKMLWFAFVGGLILNIMPCVFPVIALKILGFVNQSKEAPQRVFKLGLIYALGVIFSLAALAGLVIVGKLGSWGEQMQSPQFSVALTTLVMLVALNLFGVFEVTLGGGAMGTASTLASKEGAAGAFFNGVFTVILATPCSAPFLVSAVGFAFAQPPMIILLTFLMIGVGLAFPYVLLSWHPGWLRFLPRPGAWMEKFKIAMGFPMLATTIWLFSFTWKRFGEDGSLWLGLFLVVVALAFWVWGEFVQRGSKRKGFAMAISLLLLGTGYLYALEGELHWRSPVKKVRTDGVIQSSPEGIAWQPWSPEAVVKARAEGHPVLVDFTADWCVTCKNNKRAAIEIPATRAKLKEINAVAFIADFTDQDPAILVELKNFKHSAVPMLLLYPKDPTKPPAVLPTNLGRIAGGPQIMLEALEQAAK